MCHWHISKHVFACLQVICYLSKALGEVDSNHVLLDKCLCIHWEQFILCFYFKLTYGVIQQGQYQCRELITVTKLTEVTKLNLRKQMDLYKHAFTSWLILEIDCIRLHRNSITHSYGKCYLISALLTFLCRWISNSIYLPGCECYLWKSGSSMWSQGKHSEDPHVGDCRVAWFIRVGIEASPWVSNVPSPSVPPWKKFEHVLSEANTKASVQSFCFILKLSPLEPTGSC